MAHILYKVGFEPVGLVCFVFGFFEFLYQILFFSIFLALFDDVQDHYYDEQDQKRGKSKNGKFV